MNDGSGSLEGIIAPCLSSGVCNARVCIWNPCGGRNSRKQQQRFHQVYQTIKQPSNGTERTGLGEARWFAVKGSGRVVGREDEEGGCFGN